MHVLLMRGKAKDDITYDYMIQSWVNIYLLLKRKKQYTHTRAHTRAHTKYIYISHSKPIQQTGQQVETKPHDISQTYDY